MIAVETVLRKLISEYEFVIIPGFGALISHHIPAFYDKNSAFFSPPAKKLAFNEYLKLDDGLLANYISRQEKWTHTEAVDFVKSYTDKLRLNLESTGEASITGIGEFSRNVEGKLVFEPKTEKYFKDEWYGFEKIKVKQFNKAVINRSVGEVYTAEEEVEVLEYEDDKVRPFKWARWAAAAVVTGLLCGLSFFMVNSGNGDIKSTLNPFTELFSKSEETVVERVEEELPVVTTPAPAVVKVDSAAIVRDSAVAAAPSPKPEEPVANERSVPEVEPAMKFYVIAGAFKGPKQANVLLADLQSKGFENALIVPGDKYSTKVKVAIDDYESEPEAYRAAVKFRKVVGQEAWVFKKKQKIQ